MDIENNKETPCPSCQEDSINGLLCYACTSQDDGYIDEEKTAAQWAKNKAEFVDVDPALFDAISFQDMDD